MRKMRRFRSSCACVKYHPGFYSPFIHSVVSNDSVSWKWRTWSDYADVQADLGLRCPHMPEDTFSHGSTHLINYAPGSVIPADLNNNNNDKNNSNNASPRSKVKIIPRTYRYYFKYWNRHRHVWANSVDQVQTQQNAASDSLNCLSLTSSFST